MKKIYKSEHIREIIIHNRKFEIDIMKESISKLKDNNLLDEKFHGEDKNLLLFSVLFKNIKIAKILIDFEADIEISDCNRMSPLMHACYFDLKELVNLLIQKGSNLNRKTKIYRWTALMHASYANSIESAKILIQNNADIHILDNERKKAIDIARIEDNDEIVKLLERTNNKE